MTKNKYSITFELESSKIVTIVKLLDMMDLVDERKEGNSTEMYPEIRKKVREIEESIKNCTI